VIAKLDVMVRATQVDGVHGGNYVPELSVSLLDLANKLNEVIDRLNASPTLDEAIAVLERSDYGSDKALAVVLARVRSKWA
jgi:hypothetical protein